MKHCVNCTLQNHIRSKKCLFRFDDRALPPCSWYKHDNAKLCSRPINPKGEKEKNSPLALGVCSCHAFRGQRSVSVCSVSHPAHADTSLARTHKAPLWHQFHELFEKHRRRLEKIDERTENAFMVFTVWSSPCGNIPAINFKCCRPRRMRLLKQCRKFSCPPY